MAMLVQDRTDEAVLDAVDWRDAEAASRSRVRQPGDRRRETLDAVEVGWRGLGNG
jgi:hypothetical protein